MKTCPKCGTQTETKFCPNCGTELLNVPEDIMPAEKAVPVEKNLEENMQSSNSNNNFDAKPIYKSKKPIYKRWWFIVLIILIAVSIVGCLGMDTENESPVDTETASATTEEIPKSSTKATEKSTTETKFNAENYKDIAYADLARNPDKYEFEQVRNSGKVIQVIEGEDEIQLRVAIGGDYNNVVLVTYDPSIRSSRILENDYITYYGTSLGTITYESTLGGGITVPAVLVTKIKLH